MALRIGRTLLGISFAMAGCTPMPSEPQVKDFPGLPRSRICSNGLVRSIGGTQEAPMTMNNDGGWCWIRWFDTLGVGVVYAPILHVTTPPANGQIDIVRGEDRTRIAYKPNPGFVGEDRFTYFT